jgi:hypothetical protein
MAQAIALEQAIHDVTFMSWSIKRVCKKLSPGERVNVGRYAVEHGNTVAAAHFQLNESTVRGIKRKYLEAVAESIDETLQCLPEMKRGRKCLLGNSMDNEIQEYIRHQRTRGSVVTRATVIGVGKAIVLKHDMRMLVEYGGSIDLTKHWAESILHRMKFVKRRGSTKVHIKDEEFERVKKAFLNDIRTCVIMEDIPSSLIINWDQTAISIVPGSQWTMAPSGSR